MTMIGPKSVTVLIAAKEYAFHRVCWKARFRSDHFDDRSFSLHYLQLQNFLSQTYPEHVHVRILELLLALVNVRELIVLIFQRRNRPLKYRMGR